MTLNQFLQNLPFFSIMIALISGVVCSVLPGKAAKRVNAGVIVTVAVLSAVTLVYTLRTGTYFVYTMGHFPAPWGNEIRAGVLEALTALMSCIVMLLSLMGGYHKLDEEVEPGKVNYYYVLVNLLLTSLLALIYTNDLFTAYVFVEINTIAACGLIMIRQIGRTIEAAVRYMIMNLLGSGLLLLGICMMYGITGHLLMSNIQESVAQLAASGEYHVPLLVSIALMCVGLAIKSALFPFHTWLPDAYGYSTISSAAILSSLVSKGYIFLLIKIIYRVVGFEVFQETHIVNVLFVFGLAGMIFGSLSAIRENDVRRMIAFSPIAQIGYIYMGIGLGSELGMIAAVFHIFSHSASKALVFISTIGMTDMSGFSRKFIRLTGAAYRNVIAGIGFTVASLSMVGVPLFAGFISKLLFAQAGVSNHVGKLLPTMIVLAVSTILNAIYYLKTVIRIYVPSGMKDEPRTVFGANKCYTAAIIGFILLNFTLGIFSQPFVDMISEGLSMFA